MKFNVPKFNLSRLPALADLKSGLKIPSHAKWAMALVAAIIALGFVAYFGYFIVLVSIIVVGIVGAYWPACTAALLVSAALGGAISRQRQLGITSGVAAGLFYALLVAIVALVFAAVWIAVAGFH